MVVKTLLAALLPLFQLSQEADLWKPEAAPAYTLAQAEAWRGEVIPHVEAVAGRSFRSVPGVRLVSRAELLESLVDEALIARRAIDTEFDEDLARMELGLDFIMVAPGLLGKYNHARGTLELAAGNVEPLLALSGTPAGAMAAIMKLVVAHELTHALHAQHVDFPGQVASTRTSGEVKALGATSEGFAMLVQERVAERLGLAEANQQLVDLLSLRWHGPSEGSLARRRFDELYRGGLRFFRHHAGDGGAERVWALLERPPVVYAQIRQPASYGDPVETTVNLDRLFAGVQGLIGPEENGPWNDTAMTVAPDRVSRTYRQLGPDAVADVEALVVEAHTCLYQNVRRRPARICNVTCIVLRDEDAGPAMVARASALGGAMFEPIRKLAASGKIRLDEPAPGVVAGFDEGRSAVRTITLEPVEGGAAGMGREDLVVAAACRGPVMAQIIGTNAWLEPEAIRAILERVLERWNSGAARVPVEPPDRDDPLVARLETVGAKLPGEGWTAEIREIGKSGLEQVIGENVQGQIALEVGLLGARGGFYELPSATPGASRALVVMFVECRDREAAKAIAAALAANIRAPLARFSRMPGARVGSAESERRTLASGLEIASVEGTVQLPGSGRTSLAVRVASAGRHVVHLTDVASGLTGDALDGLAGELLEGL